MLPVSNMKKVSPHFNFSAEEKKTHVFQIQRVWFFLSKYFLRKITVSQKKRTLTKTLTMFFFVNFVPFTTLDYTLLLTFRFYIKKNNQSLISIHSIIWSNCTFQVVTVYKIILKKNDWPLTNTVGPTKISP